MNKKFFLHLAYLFLAVVLAFFWTQHPKLSFYNLQLVALLILIFFAKNLLFKKSATKTIDTIILCLVVLFLVFSTGGASSPLFFLIYFLLFGLSFLFEPPITIILSIILMIFFLPSVVSVNEVAAVFSLVLIAPLSLFFGQQYLENLRAQKRIRIYKTRWLADEEALEKEETNVLFWLSTKFKPAIVEIIEKNSQLLSDIGRLTPTQKTLLKRIRRLSKQLLAGGKKLERLVDLETDDE